MGKKILFLGYKPFLSAILKALEKTSFIEDNSCDVIIAQPNTSQSLLKGFKRLAKKRKIKRIREEVILRLQLLLFKSKNKTVIKQLFKEVSLNNLKAHKNISFIDYRGLDEIESLEDYDFMIVASFGIKIPEYIYNAPKYRTLNIHPSYLPELRGGYPTYISAFLKDPTSGCTIHYMEKGWDSGDIILRKREEIKQESTNEVRFSNSAQIAAKLLNNLNDTNFIFESKKQKKSEITYCHKILKYRNYIKTIEKDKLEGYVLANYSKSLFPFTYGYYKGFLIMVLKIKKLKNVNNTSNIKFFKKENELRLQHYDSTFVVKKYIFKGKLVSL